MKRIALVLMGVVALQVPAHAGVFDFEDLAVGANANFTETNSGVTGTFLGTATEIHNDSGRPASWGSRSMLPCLFTTNHMTVSFDQGLSSIGFEFGDFFSDDDTMHLRAFDASNTLVGSADVFYPANLGIPNDIGTISTTSSGGPITHIELWDTGGSGQNNIYTDNMSFTTAVPEPASIAILGLGALALLRRRRK